ncbi:MAG: LemA family protein [Nitrospiraceae bacterium]|nr:LemA family protein [Nitrospiraceae bacterium]
MIALTVVILIILAGIAVLALLSGIALYGRLARLRAAARSARSDPESRRDVSAAVREYNDAAETFPSNIIAGMFKFRKEDLPE